MSTNQTQHYHLNLWEPEDSFLRTEFNENTAALETALLQKSETVTSAYVGNGQSARYFSLGFQAKAIILKKRDEYPEYSHSAQVRNVPTVTILGQNSNVLSIQDDGFTVTGHGLVNEANQLYIYIAFRN